MLALFVAILIAVIALLDSHGTFHRWRYPPAPPLEVEAIMPERAPVQRLPRGAAVNASGLLTIVRVPSTQVEPKPIVHGTPVPASTAAGPDFDPTVAGGIRAFFRTRLQPQNNRLVTTTLEYKYTQLRLVLIDGCFRAQGPNGPVAVFPPGARLFMDNGYLSVGVPGSPGMRARVGEELFWEAYAVQIIDPNSLELVQSICGSGTVMQVVPSSASAYAARQDAAAAMEFQRGSKGVSWAAAVRAVKECDRRMEAAMRRDNPNAPEILVGNMCGSSLVNPPDPGSCPPGTRFKRGNCFDDQGLDAAVAAPPAAPSEPPPAPPN
jgi:hypothetical protein